VYPTRPLFRGTHRVVGGRGHTLRGTATPRTQFFSPCPVALSVCGTIAIQHPRRQKSACACTLVRTWSLAMRACPGGSWEPEPRMRGPSRDPKRTGTGLLLELGNMRILGCRGMRTDGRGQSTHRAWPAFGLLHLVSFVRLGRRDPGPGRPAHATDLPHGPHRAISRARRSGVGVVAISLNRLPPRVPCACRGRLVHAAISPA
jgi:hypothetical protein